MKKKLLFYYKQLSLTKKLLIPILLSLLSGLILILIISKYVNEINRHTFLLENTLVPSLEKMTNNKALLKKISENFTFAILAEEEDMILENVDNKIIENNFQKIILNKKTNSIQIENAFFRFQSYFKIAHKYALNSINNNGKNSEASTHSLLAEYNKVDDTFNNLQENIKGEITSTIKLIDKISNQLMYFTIIYILIFSLGLFYISYMIYKDFNQRFKILNKNLNALSINKSLLETNSDVLDTLANNIDETVTQYEIINRQRKELALINQNIQDSIEYASFIQESILPAKETLDKYTKDNFVFLKQKDTVGGDIYLITELQSKNEILIMIIDGVGHGVSGAFLTILAKSLEHEIIEKINQNLLDPSPAKILKYFNQHIKSILQQEKGSKSNVGFDGGILYYNKSTNSCKYAGAKTPLYILNKGKLSVIKSDRKSIGFIRTKINQEYTEYDIEIKKETKLYISTDGIIDQEGVNSSRYGTERFQKFLTQNHNIPFEQQLLKMQKSLGDFQKKVQQSDDITIIGLEFL